MIRELTRQDYRARILRVVEYIHDHLDDELDMARLASVAAFSPYHWHRVYRGIAGETAAQTVRRLRLHRAAAALAGSQQPIAQIARAAGYGSTAAFTRAFGTAYGATPALYRQRGITPGSQPVACLNPNEDFSAMTYNVTIKTLPSRHIAAMSHKGPYMNIGEAFDKLVVLAEAPELLAKGARTVGVYYDDPASVAPDALRADAGIEIPAGHAVPEPLHKVELEGGRHAVLRHRGPYAELETAYNWLFGTWLPESGEEAADRPPFEIYLNDCKSLPPSQWLTDICLPLAER